MRLWTIHPKYLDMKGLGGAWREALLAQKVLEGGTRGYTKHPQLIRFRAHSNPVGAVATFLVAIVDEAKQRGYNYDASKINPARITDQIDETSGQLAYEWQHLLVKLKKRDADRYRQYSVIAVPDTHPIFRIVPGDIQSWEKTELDADGKVVMPGESKGRKRKLSGDKGQRSSDVDNVEITETRLRQSRNAKNNASDKMRMEEKRMASSGRKRKVSVPETEVVTNRPSRKVNQDHEKNEKPHNRQPKNTGNNDRTSRSTQKDVASRNNSRPSVQESSHRARQPARNKVDKQTVSELAGQAKKQRMTRSSSQDSRLSGTSSRRSSRRSVSQSSQEEENPNTSQRSNSRRKSQGGSNVTRDGAAGKPSAKRMSRI